MHALRVGTIAAGLAWATACAGGADNGFSSTPDDDGYVSGDAVIALSFEQLTFQGVEPGIGDTEVLEISSEGDADLIVSAAWEDNDDLVFFFLHDDEADATVIPGEMHELTLAVLVATAGENHEATLRLDTNDADRPTIRIPVKAIAAP